MDRFNTQNENDMIDVGAATGGAKGSPLLRSHDTVGSIPVTVSPTIDAIDQRSELPWARFAVWRVSGYALMSEASYCVADAKLSPSMSGLAYAPLRTRGRTHSTVDCFGLVNAVDRVPERYSMF